MKNYNAILCDTDDLIAEDSNTVRHDKMKRKAKEKESFGETQHCTKIVADNGKSTFYVKPGQDITERLNHYRIRHPDAKIVK
jgi:hypothetical protein